MKLAAEELRADREVVLAAVSHDEHGIALHWAAEELRADREIILAALGQNGYALHFTAGSCALTERLSAQRSAGMREPCGTQRKSHALS